MAEVEELSQDAVELAARIEELFHDREREALELILRTACRARRSMRFARETPREGVESALDLIAALAKGGLGA